MGRQSVLVRAAPGLPRGPSPADVKKARKAFARNEVRNLFYPAARILVEQAYGGRATLTLAQALAVLLQTWNVSYYRFRPQSAHNHLRQLDRALKGCSQLLAQCRSRDIADFDEKEGDAIKRAYEKLERVTGPVGAAKALHVVAPRFFPLWDRKIASAYGLSLGKSGTNAERYLTMLSISQRQCLDLRAHGFDVPDLLKALDEYNYCRFTRGWV